MQKKTHLLLYALFLVLLMTERFLVPMDTYNVISAVIGLLAVALCMSHMKRKKKSETLSFTFRWEKPVRSVFYALLVPVLSVAIVLAVEQYVFRMTGHSGWMIVPARHLYFGDLRTASALWVGKDLFLRWMLIGLAVTLVRALFLELSFRGYGLYASALQNGPQIGNLLHTLCFTAVLSVPPVYGLVKSYFAGETMPGKAWVYLVAGGAIVLYFFLLGYRQGALRVLSQSVIPCILSYWIFDFSTSIVNTSSFWPAYLAPFSSVFRMLAVQLVASLLSIPMFVRNKKTVQNRLGKPADAEVDIDEIAASVLRRAKAKEEPEIE